MRSSADADAAVHTPKVVLVTGVARELASRVARRLADDPTIERVIGVDLVAPKQPVGRVQFVRSDIRSPLVSRLIEQAQVDTVVHMGVIATPRDAGGRVVQKDINVLGTMQLLAACQKASGMRRLVVKSTAGIYGASPRDPTAFTESMTARAAPRSDFARDSLEVEGYVRGMSRRRPDVGVNLLRLAPVIGPTVRTVLTDYYSRSATGWPMLPMAWGREGRLQFVHEDDAVAACAHAVRAPAVGACNVAGEGVITSSQAAAMARAMPLPVPASLWGPARSILPLGAMKALTADYQAFLSYGRVLHTGRMRDELGFKPQHSTGEAFEDFLTSLRERDRSQKRNDFRQVGA